jgi:hypothetical protein
VDQVETVPSPPLIIFFPFFNISSFFKNSPVIVSIAEVYIISVSTGGIGRSCIKLIFLKCSI